MITTGIDVWEDIAEFCPTIRDMVTNPCVSEIDCNPDGSVYADIDGQMQRMEVTMPAHERENGATQMARVLDKDIGKASPTFDGWLPGIRICATCPPISEGWCLSIRRFRDKSFTFSELVDNGTIREDGVTTLIGLIEDHKTILVSGGTFVGKTSLCNTLCSIIHEDDRVIVIEDTRELQVPVPNLVRFVSAPDLEINIRELVRHSMRFCPTRIIVGEVRGPEAFDLLMVLNSGHDGSMSTIHASSADQALEKLVFYAAIGSAGVPSCELKQSAAQSIHAVVQLRRVNGRRVVHKILEVEGYSTTSESFTYTELYSHTAKA